MHWVPSSLATDAGSRLGEGVDSQERSAAEEDPAADIRRSADGEVYSWQG